MCVFNIYFLIHIELLRLNTVKSLKETIYFLIRSLRCLVLTIRIRALALLQSSRPINRLQQIKIYKNKKTKKLCYFCYNLEHVMNN